MGKMKKISFMNSIFSLSNERDIDTNSFLKNSNELPKFIDKIRDKYDGHPSIYYTGNIYVYFR